MGVKYELYADVWFVTNFSMDIIALWIAGRIMKQRVRVWRLLLAGFVGTSGAMCLFFFLSDYTWYQLGVHFLANPLMVWLCYRSRKWKQFFCQWFLSYLSVILLGGFLQWSASGRGAGSNFWIYLAGAALFLAAAEKIMGSIRRQKDTVCELLLVTRAGNIAVKGFFDTGNLLVDPTVGKPVHIIRREILEGQIEEGQLMTRLIPFHSLGEENGMLEAVTIEGMYILKEEQPLYLEKPVLGLAREKLFQYERYDVILNGRSMEN